MSVLTDSCYSEDRYSAMGSIMCPETDTRTLEARKDIYASTNVRDHPRKGIIKPKLHYDEKIFQCEICSKRFNHVGNLNKHRRVHSGEKPYGCEYCEMRFNNISNKKLHENRHRGERNIICEVGSKSFHDMHHLERHRTVHLSSLGLLGQFIKINQ
uniref:C2H2-type domain-containing protein n=1 Tax=Anopheles christyi TaxID=43041 RepID=A0A182JRC2_9DIPT